MKRVSAIIPCYCLKEEWLERLFHSIEHQVMGMEWIEVVFVVDASPDDTLERLKKYEEKYPDDVLIINSDEKMGPGGARSLGISYASGEYVAFIDQDDWIEPCMFAHMYQKAKEYQCDVVESYNTRDMIYDYRDGLPKTTGQESRFVLLDTVEKRKDFFAKNKPERRKYWAKLYKREFLLEEKIDFPKNIHYDDNYFKGMVFYHAKRIYILEEYMYHWMVNQESISMKADVNVHLERMQIELLKLQEYEKRGLLAFYREEMEYIFLEQFYANTFNTVCTRNDGISVELLDYMKSMVCRIFPEYEKNPYIATRRPVWSLGDWIENALLGIAQVRGKEVTVPIEVLNKIAPLSFLDLLKTQLSQEELSWFCNIYIAFDKVAHRIDYSKLKK